jgi:hypothetical protein
MGYQVTALEVECGSRQTLKEAQGAVVGLVPDPEACGPNALARKQGVVDPPQDLQYSSERWIMKKLFLSSVPTQPSRFRQHGLTRRYIERHISRRYIIDSQQAHGMGYMFHGWFGGSLLVGTGPFQEKYRSLSEDRCRFGCAAPRPTVRFR